LGAPRTTSQEAFEPDEGQRHEVLGIVAAAVTILLLLALWSYHADRPDNWIGPVGRHLARLLAQAFGVGAWLLPMELGLLTVRLFGRRTSLLGFATVASTLVLVLVGCGMLHLGLPQARIFGDHLPGGVLGEVLGEVLRSLFGLVGAFVVGITVLLVTLVLRTPVSVVAIAVRAAHGAIAAGRSVAHGAMAVLEAWREASELEAAERDAAERDLAPRIVAEGLDDDLDDDEGYEDAEGDLEEAFEAHGAEAPEADEDAVPDDELDEARPASRAQPRRGRAGGGPRIVAPSPEALQRPPTDPGAADEPARGQYLLPPARLLEEAPPSEVAIDSQVLKANAARLVEKLEAYGVKGRVDEIHPGPVVTMYEFEPQSGTKISKIAGLADDLAMALAAQKVRIVAPIPGKARVGFELPNENRQTVYLRSILEDERWQKAKGALPMALGKDIAGQPVYVDLSKMPHLLVAGATGAGKSVGLNVMLTSLLTKKSPEDVRMLMIDPKMVELAVFDGIPHMLLPVVTDMKKAALALKWAVDEMERRYQLFADAGARNIITYNERVEKVLRGELPVEKLKLKKPKPSVHAGPGDAAEVPQDRPPDKLPYVVVVVDEFADLMMVAAKDVEACIARLAQKARAAGIHVILATQRPSVDVITGMIKANFPARIAFKVSQREDSKTILGRNGAEHLLGMGDMLMIPPGASDPKRVHCAFLSEEEVREVCDFARAQGAPVYDEEILKPRDDEGEGGFDGASSDDPLYDRAVAVVAQAGYCSISHIQRQLSVGYNKAAKLVERMEQEGVVGPATGKAGGRREVLVQSL
jgi:DNA segregation ATPase FtsK/SpoIIIE, S-DNA-T family